MLISCLALALAGCGDTATEVDDSQQVGPNPVLPEPSQELLPDLKIAEVTGWQDGTAPIVPEGLVVTAYAKDLVNPRTVHTLPNGDVLVVQSRAPEGKPLERPKDFIRNWLMSMGKGSDGGPPKESNLITLLRDTNRDGTVDERHNCLRSLIHLLASPGLTTRFTSRRRMPSFFIHINLARLRSRNSPPC